MIIKIDSRDETPLYEQLCRQILFGIAAGWLRPGEALPSARRLAADLGVNFHTVHKAYALLTEDGYLATDRRKGAVVAWQPKDGDAFLQEFGRLLSIGAAKAICNRMEEGAFIERCAECYRRVKGGNPHE